MHDDNVRLSAYNSIFSVVLWEMPPLRRRCAWLDRLRRKAVTMLVSRCGISTDILQPSVELSTPSLSGIGIFGSRSTMNCFVHRTQSSSSYAFSNTLGNSIRYIVGYVQNVGLTMYCLCCSSNFVSDTSHCNELLCGD